MCCFMMRQCQSPINEKFHDNITCICQTSKLTIPTHILLPNTLLIFRACTESFHIRTTNYYNIYLYRNFTYQNTKLLIKQQQNKKKEKTKMFNVFFTTLFTYQVLLGLFHTDTFILQEETIHLQILHILHLSAPLLKVRTQYVSQLASVKF